MRHHGPDEFGSQDASYRVAALGSGPSSLPQLEQCSRNTQSRPECGGWTESGGSFFTEATSKLSLPPAAACQSAVGDCANTGSSTIVPIQIMYGNRAGRMRLRFLAFGLPTSKDLVLLDRCFVESVSVSQVKYFFPDEAGNP
jgi:hypothetical protein